MNLIESLFAEKIEKRNYLEAILDNFSFVDMLIEQSDVERVMTESILTGKAKVGDDTKKALEDQIAKCDNTIKFSDLGDDDDDDDDKKEDKNEKND